MDWGISRNIRPGTPEFEALVEGVIWQESRNNPNARNSGSGASGLMQVMPGTAASPGFGVTPLDWGQVYNASENRRFGSEYLAAMLNRYDGDVARALAAYNWGPGNADRWNGDYSRLPAETQGYISNIVSGRTAANSGGGSPQGLTARGSTGSPGDTMMNSGQSVLTPATGYVDERRAAFEANMQSLANLRNMADNSGFSAGAGLDRSQAGGTRAGSTQMLEPSRLQSLFS